MLTIKFKVIFVYYFYIKDFRANNKGIYNLVF